MAQNRRQFLVNMWKAGGALLIVALVLTVIGTFFRGPGWQWVDPWHHLYVEL